ncbi:hypothetical protein SAMN05216281_104207 [Cryobacterium luteum]|nr:hypothetical protein SAMN05216281_104207 [Cryobacterium luteum]
MSQPQPISRVTADDLVVLRELVAQEFGAFEALAESIPRA